MKYLMLMRHAKSSWGDETLPDIERTLNARGERDAKRIGVELLARGAVPEVIIASTAVRAAETCRLVCSGLDDQAQPVIVREPHLYAATSDRILDIVHEVCDDFARALLIGHNPGMEELLTRLTTELQPGGMKTSMVACIAFDVSTWDEVQEGLGSLEWILSPGQFSAE